MFAEIKHTLRRLRGQIIGWSIGLGLYGLVMVSLFDSIVNIEGIEELMASYPPELLGFFGDSLTGFTTPEGYVDLYYFLYMPIIIGIFAASAGAHLLVGDEEKGTLDLISGGRVVIGAGVGGAFNDAQRQEWRNAGVDPSTRGSRFEEVVDIASNLTKGEPVSFDGKHFSLDSVKMQPSSLQSDGIPFLVACHWQAGRDRQFKRAATQ